MALNRSTADELNKAVTKAIQQPFFMGVAGLLTSLWFSRPLAIWLHLAFFQGSLLFEIWNRERRAEEKSRTPGDSHDSREQAQ
jgi:hypothetical protein